MGTHPRAVRFGNVTKYLGAPNFLQATDILSATLYPKSQIKYVKGKSYGNNTLFFTMIS